MKEQICLLVSQLIIQVYIIARSEELVVARLIAFKKWEVYIIHLDLQH